MSGHITEGQFEKYAKNGIIEYIDNIPSRSDKYGNHYLYYKLAFRGGITVIRCSAKAFAKCPTRALCGSVDDATFAEGSECDRFNQSVEGQPLTYWDKIRMLSDRELLTIIKRLVSMGDISGLYCANFPECKELAEFDEPVPQEWCDKCLLEWLQREVGGQK